MLHMVTREALLWLQGKFITVIINAHKSCDTIILFSSSSKLCKTRETVDIFVRRRSKRQRDKEERTEKWGRSRAHQRLINPTFNSLQKLQQPQASDFVQDIAPWSNKSPLKSLPSRGQVVDLCRAKWCLSSWSLSHVSVSVSGLYLVGVQVNLLFEPHCTGKDGYMHTLHATKSTHLRANIYGSLLLGCGRHGSSSALSLCEYFRDPVTR
jgi:hypothetical protein